MSWKNNIPGSFGDTDADFAMHFYDEERAKKLLISAIEAGVSKEEYVEAIKTYLIEKNCNKDHIEKQLKKVIDLGSYLG